MDREMTIEEKIRIVESQKLADIETNKEGTETPKREVRMKKLRSNALITLDDAKDRIMTSPFVPEDFNLDASEVENVLISLINSISSQVEDIIGRELGRKEYYEAITISNNPFILLNNFPVREISRITALQGNGPVDYPLNSEMIVKLNSKRDLSKGKVYIEPAFFPRAILVGVNANKYQDLRTVMMTYEAGYILPGEETEELQSDLPASISGIVMDVVSRQFRQLIDSSRSDDLIQLQEGNINRMWGTNVMKELNREGYFDKAEVEILNRYSARRAIYSV